MRDPLPITRLTGHSCAAQDLLSDNVVVIEEEVVRDAKMTLLLSDDPHWNEHNDLPAEVSSELHPREATAARRLRSISSIAAWSSGETGLFGPGGGRNAKCRQR